MYLIKWNCFISENSNAKMNHSKHIQKLLSNPPVSFSVYLEEWE